MVQSFDGSLCGSEGTKRDDVLADYGLDFRLVETRQSRAELPERASQKGGDSLNA